MSTIKPRRRARKAPLYASIPIARKTITYAIKSQKWTDWGYPSTDGYEAYIDSIGTGYQEDVPLQSFNLISLSGNRLQFSTNDEQNRKLFEMHENYIEKKSEEFFGKRIKFNWSTEKAEITNTHRKTASKSKFSADSLEEVILNEFGGQKIQ